jgi:hypothetical protein
VPNLLRAGAVWAQQQRHLHYTDTISLGGVSLLATTPATDTEVERGGVKLAAKFSKFIVRHSDITLYSIVLVRGMEILWGDNVYEVTNEAGNVFYYNDPFELDIVIMAIKR